MLLDWLDTKTATLESTDPVSNDSDEYSPGLEYQRLREAIKHIERLYHQRGSQEADLCAGAPGGAKFVIDVGDIIDTLPKIQIPGMGLLFHWAEWVAVDLNRDGKVLGVPLPSGEDHIVESDEIAFVPQQLQISDTLALEQWARLQRIDSLLSAPVQTAKQKYEAAKTKAEQNQAKKRLDSAQGRYLECINVFMLDIDGYSRTEIAAYLGMTEDEVRGRMAQIAELIAPEFIEAYRRFQGEKLMRQLVKLDEQKVQNLAEIAGKLPLPEWPSEVMTHLLKLPQAQANARLRIAEQDKRHAETQLLEKVMENSEPMNRVEAREAFLKTVMTTDLWDQHTLVSLGLKRDNVHRLKQRILKAELAIQETTADLETLQQDFTRRATLYPALLALILHSPAAEQAAIADQLGFDHVEQLQQYRERIQVILEHISTYRGDCNVIL